jgi:hypothetical protein
MREDSVFKQTFFFLRQHNAGVENIADMKAAGFAGVFCNIGDPVSPPDAWITIRTRCAAYGMFCGPWLRTQDPDGSFSWSRLDWLLSIADQWNPLSGFVVVNSESELQGTQDTVTGPMRSRLGNRDAAVCMEPQPFDNVQWWPLKDIPILAQFSTTTRTDVSAMLDLWHGYGIECMFPTFGAFGGSNPSDYNLVSPYSVYTADDCGQNYAAWSPKPGKFEGCIPAKEETKVAGVKFEVDNAWYWFEQSAVLENWREDNKGEYTKLSNYYYAAAGTPPPTTGTKKGEADIVTKTGKGLLALIEAGKWADGTHT